MNIGPAQASAMAPMSRSLGPTAGPLSLGPAMGPTAEAPPAPMDDGRVVPFLPAPDDSPTDKWLIPVIAVLAVATIAAILACGKWFHRRAQDWASAMRG